MVALLLIGAHVINLAWAFLHPRLWVPVDVYRFKQDGGKDSLLRTFHRQRAWWRGVAIVVPALLCSLPALLLGLHPALVSAGGLVAMNGGYWLWYFNPTLNVARELPYVGKYHVSWNPDASWLDRQIWRWAWTRVRREGEWVLPAREDLRVVAVAGPLYKKILLAALVLGTVLYLPAVVYLYIVWKSPLTP